ncbi:MAG: hypothetical protein ACI9FB_000972 [Candidatus Azotimanducaceae bacterium]|jgi:hypothetical protein
MKFNPQHLILVLAVLMTSACIQVDTGSKIPTIGDQIVDLVKANKLGVISDEEFRQLRTKALASF